MSKIKKILAILIVVLFIWTMTTVALEARDGNGGGHFMPESGLNSGVHAPDYGTNGNAFTDKSTSVIKINPAFKKAK